MTYSIEKITTLIGAHRYGSTDANIGWMLTDSRSLCFPEETLFFALKSERNDGMRYIPDLYHRGVRNFVVATLPDNSESLYPNANFLKVADTLVALQRLAERHREAFSIPVVGITGSNGKTIVKEWLYQLLSPERVVTRSPRSYNSQIGVPLSVWLLDKRSEVGLFEAGISQKGEMGRLRSIIQPTIGVLTSLGSAHQENFTSLEEKCKEKCRLFHDTKALVFCADDDTVRKTIDEAHYPGERVDWSMVNPKAALFISKVTKENDHTEVEYVFRGEKGQYRLPFIDEASVVNSITCVAVARLLGMTAQQLQEKMPTLEQVAMRLEVKVGRHGCTLINDSYNSDINSLDIALDFMNRRPDHQGRRRTLILSDIFQSGLPDNQLYQEVASQLEKRAVDKLIGIGQAITAQKQLFHVKEQHFFSNTNEFIASSIFETLHDEVILIKGARLFNFDQLTDLLVEKVHETTLEVNLNALVDNVNHFRSMMHPDTKMACMIKADGYGTGAVEIAKTLQEHRVEYMAVAVADEGVTLRRNGVTANIMVMNPEMTSFKTLFDFELEPEVYNFRLLDALIRAAQKEGITDFPVHVKIDTGMHRLGFDINDIPLLIERLQQQNAVIPRSIFSHFVGSDSDDFDRFSALQFDRFEKAANMLQAAFPHHILRHICNSAGIEHFPERQLDMCRLGLGLYGISSRDNHIIHNVATLKTTILQIRNVPKEDTVGYSRKGVLQRDSRIAAIPIGYADGLDRHLGRGRGYCLVNGKPAPYVGNICMDVTMIDVTDIPCQEGDSVEIFGDNLPPTTLAEWLDTIPYEILTSVSNRVKRVYYQD
ncbi:MAG: bifunctional UDP-N-acetylmuramoyl-tripeptide:D-alanyl-D-alanine ligase/alanine racemase [Prevotella sp.]|nr:bifunctional UDP-N-acetylmuramoyl-tripeptide:D-alanyl-D-alanine ligase/alanine racemase [Prevotella sp.]